MPFPIVALIGPSGSGKTTLILKLVAQHPERFAVLRSFTTRAWREPQDDVFYECISHAEFERRRDAGLLLPFTKYAGNVYGNVRAEVEEARRSHIPLLALIEEAAHNFRSEGYPLISIGVIPRGEKFAPRPDPLRTIEDAARAQDTLVLHGTVVNSFDPGGLDRAVADLLRIIDASLPHQ
ncbi:MAG: hypothetical protein Q8P82_02695 [bacterium]|nr:hypothetical protein [bacterium]